MSTYTTPVYVDVVESGKALIVGGGHQARVGRDGIDRGARFYVEDADTEQVIGHVRTYRAAGLLFASHHELADAAVVVEHEKGA
jgi:hypothetical protein